MKPIPAPARLFLAAAMLALPLLLAGCESKVTVENYDKINNGMTMYEVEQLLGKGTDDTTTGGFGASAGGVVDSKQTNEKSYIWTDGESKIMVVFKDSKVVQKSKIGL